jgi:hypothetical protein
MGVCSGTPVVILGMVSGAVKQRTTPPDQAKLDFCC